MIRTPFLITAFFTVFGLAACQTETVQSGSQPVVMSTPPESPPTPAPSTPNTSNRAHSEFQGLNAATDPCAAQLQDICGALLLAYATNKKLPPTLEELQPYAQGVTLSFTCPASGKRYAYVPQGLSAQNVHDLLVIYDETPAHNNQRWGIVMTPPTPGTATTMYVIPLNEKLFKAYQPR